MKAVAVKPVAKRYPGVAAAALNFHIDPDRSRTHGDWIAERQALRELATADYRFVQESAYSSDP